MSAPSTPCTPPPGHWPSAATRCSRSRSRRRAGSVSALADRRDHRRRPRPAPPPPRPHHMINKHGKLLLGMVRCALLSITPRILLARTRSCPFPDSSRLRFASSLRCLKLEQHNDLPLQGPSWRYGVSAGRV